MPADRTLVYRRLFGGPCNGRRHTQPLESPMIQVLHWPKKKRPMFLLDNTSIGSEVRTIHYYRHITLYQNFFGRTLRIIWWSNEIDAAKAHTQLEKWWHRGGEFE